MNTFQLFGRDALTETTQAALEDAIAQTQASLFAFASSDRFLSVIHQAFDAPTNAEAITQVQQTFLTQAFDTLPTIELRSHQELQGANGAFASSTNQIFLSREFVTTGDIERIRDVLIQEIGHYIDNIVNLEDTTGDEGDHFAALVKGETLDAQRLYQIKTEDDRATLILDGQAINVELDLDEVLGQVTDTIGSLLSEFNEIKSTVEDLNSTLRAYLTSIQSGLDSQILAQSLPLIGDDLQNAADKAVRFVEGLSNDLTAQLLRLDGIANLSPDRIRQTLVDILTEQGALNLAKFLPDSVETPFTTVLQTALEEDQSITEITKSALQTALTELDSLGFLSGVLPADPSDLFNAEVLKETILELGKNELANLDTDQLRQGFIDAIANLGLANLAEIFPAGVLATFRGEVASAINGGDFDALSTAVTTAISGLPGDLLAGNAPAAAQVLDAANLNSTNLNNLSTDAVLQRVFSGLNQLESLNLNSFLSTEQVTSLLTSFQNQLENQISLPDALQNILGELSNLAPQLIAGEGPSIETLLAAAVPAWVDERLEVLRAAGQTGTQILESFSTPQALKGLLSGVNELGLFDLDQFIPTDVVTDFIDQFRDKLGDGGSLGDALSFGLQQAFFALDDLGVLPVSLPSVEEFQREVLPRLDGDNLADLTAQDFRQILFQGFNALKGLGLESFIPSEVATPLFQTFETTLAKDASITDALRASLEDAIPALEALDIFPGGSLPTVDQVLTESLIDLVADELNEIGQAQLQKALIEAVNRLGVLNLEQFVPSGEVDLLALFNSVSNTSELETAIASTLTEFGSRNLIDGAPTATQVLETAQLANISANELSQLSSVELFERVFSGLSELEVLQLDQFIPTDVITTLLSTLESEIANGQSQLEALQTTVTDAIAAFQSPAVGLLANGTIPSVSDLLTTALPELARETLNQLTSGDIRQSLFTALNELDVFNLEQFIPDGVATTLLETFKTELGNDLDPGKIPDALQATLEAALTTPQVLDLLAGELPGVETIVQELIPEFSSLLNGGIGGVLAQVAGIEGLTSLSPDTILEALITVLNEQDVFDLEALLPDSIRAPFLNRVTDLINGEQSITDILQSALGEAVSALGISSSIETLLDESTQTQTLLKLGEALFEQLAPEQLQQALFEAFDKLGALDLSSAILAEVANLNTEFQNINDPASLNTAINQALGQLNTAGLLASVPEVNQVVEVIDAVNPITDKLEDFSSDQIFQRVLSALVRLEAFELSEFIAQNQFQGLLNDFQAQLTQQVAIPEALESLLTDSLAPFNELINGETPSVQQLLSSAVPSIIDERLEGLRAQGLSATEILTELSTENVLQSLLTAVTKLDVFDLDTVIPLSLATDLITTFQTQLSSGGSLTDALISGLQQALFALDELDVIPVDIQAIQTRFETELLPRLQAIDLENLTADQFRKVLLEAADAFAGLGLQSFIPAEVSQVIFTVTQSQLEGDVSFSDALQDALNQALPVLVDSGVLPNLPNVNAVVQQALTTVGETDLKALAVEQLQEGLFDAALRGLDILNLDNYATGVPALFNAVTSQTDLRTSLANAIAQLNTLGLLKETVSVDAVLNESKLRSLSDQNLNNLSQEAIVQRVFLGLNELGVLQLNALIPQGQVSTLLNQFQTQLDQGTELLTALETLIQQTQAQLNAGLFEGGLPNAADLLAATLPELLQEQLSRITSGQLTQSVFTALNQLDVLNLTQFLPDELATALLEQFNTARSQPGASLTDAIQDTLSFAITQPDFLGTIAGNIPEVESVIQDLIPQLTGQLEGLTGFIDRILTPPINALREGLFQVLGAQGLDILPDTIPSADDISDLIPKLLFNAALRGVTDGDIAGALETALTDALGPIGLGILEQGEALAADVQEQILQEVQTRLTDPLNGLFGVEAILDQALDDLLGADVVDVQLENNLLQFDLEINEQNRLADVDLDANIGLPGLGLETKGSADLGLEFLLDFGFGFDIENRELFLDTSANQELQLLLSAAIDDLDARGTLGFLELNVEDNEENPTALALNFGVDLSDVAGSDDGRLTFGELNQAQLSELLNATLNGDVDINLGFETNFSSPIIPGLSADFVFDWSFSGESVDDAFAITPNIAFNNITLDVGSFLTDFANGILGTVGTITEPLQPFVDLLNKDVPVLNQNLIELAQNPFFGGLIQGDAPEFIAAIANVAEVINLINNSDSFDGGIDLGSFQITGVDVLEDPNQLQTLTQSLAGGDLSTLALEGGTGTPTETPESGLDQLANQGADGQQIADNLEDNPLFEFPILTDPNVALDLLLGKDNTNLFKLNLPPFTLGFEYEQTIPIVGPIVAVIGGAAGIGAGLSFGYDSFGFQAFRNSGFTAPSLLTQGLFTTNAPVPDELPRALSGFDPFPIVGVGANIFAGGGVNVGVASADVTAELIGTGALDFTDAVGDKVRIQDLANPGCILELSGALDAALAANVKVGFGFFSYTKRFEILRKTLLEGDLGGDCTEHVDQGQATVTDGLLTLNATNESDRFRVTHLEGELGNETLDVAKEGIPFTYEGINAIEGNGQDGTDIIQLEAGVLANATLSGGDGDDVLQGGDGNDEIAGNDDSDALDGGAGNDSLSGGSGEDFLQGNEGDDQLDGGDDIDSVSYATAAAGVDINLSLGENSFANDGDGGTDTITNVERIEGSRHNDRIIADNFNQVNVLDGLEGDDELRGNNGDDFLIGGPGADTLDGGTEESEGDAVSYFESRAGVSVNLRTGEVFSGGGDADGDRLIEIENVQGTFYQDVLVGNGKSNKLSGEQGNDQIEGGAGADTLDGGSGIDTLKFNTAVSGVTANLKTGEAVTIEAGDRVVDRIEPVAGVENRSTFENLEGSRFGDDLTGDVQDNVIQGLAGQDSLQGEEGNDTLVGGSGADQFDGGDGFDLADYSESDQGVSVDLVGIGAGGDAQGDTFTRQADNSQISTVENLLGSDFADTLKGGAGRNVIDPGLSNGGTDIVEGDLGTDRLRLDYSQNDVGQGIIGGFKFDTANRFERLSQDGATVLDAVEFSGIEDLTVIGTQQDDDIRAGDGDDVLLTGAGDDVVDSAQGNNVVLTDSGNDQVVAQGSLLFGFDSEDGGDEFFFLDGGTGLDTLSINLGARDEDIVIESLDPTVENPNQSITFTNGAAIRRFEAFQDVILGDGNDRFTQLGRVDNQVSLNSGNDVANAGLGFDTVIGGGGETGDDLLIVDYSVGDMGGGIRSSHENARAGGEFSRLANDETVLDSVTFESIETFHVIGTRQADDIIGGSGFDGDTLEGRDGNDRIIGLDGRDSLLGGAGNDVIEGGIGSHIIDGGTGNDTLTGSRINPFNTNFGLGVDTLTGGTGADEFRLIDITTNQSLYFDTNPNIEDSFARITDFNPEQGDRLLLLNRNNYVIQVEDGNTNIFFTLNPGSETPFIDLVALLEGVTDFDINQDVLIPGETLDNIPVELESSAPIETAPTLIRADIQSVQGDSGETPPIANLAISNGFEVEQNNRGEDLLNQLLGETNGFSDIQVKLTGDARAFATFSNDPFGLESGIVLSTGIAEDVASVNLEDGGLVPETNVNLTFEKLAGVAGNDGETAVFRAKLSDLTFPIQSLTVNDSGAATGGGSGRLSGFDLDAIKISTVSVDDASQVNGIEGLDVFDFSPLGTVLTPGTQRSPVNPDFPDFAGTINGFVDNGFARLEQFDFSPGGFVTLGDGGQVSFNLKDAIAPTPGQELFLYVGEAANNENAPDGSISVSNRRVGEQSLLSTDFGVPGAEGDTTALEIEFMADASPRDLVFQFAFASEEFLEFAGSEFNDIFQLELNGFELGRLSDGSAATINNLALSPIGQFSPDFNFNPENTGEVSDQTGLDGFTNVLTFSGAVIPNAKNQLVISVKDVTDGLLDSAIFLKAGTVESGVPQPSVIVSDDGVLNVSEEGLSDRLEISLATIPDDTVQITITPDDQLSLGGAANEPVTLTFTPDNAQTSQILDIAAIDDTLQEGAHSGQLTFAVSSADPAYDQFFIPSQTVLITDNDQNGSGPIGVDDLDGENGFAIPGIDAGDVSGLSVSHAGDINNDGIDDVVIGAPSAEPTDTRSGAGETYVIFGQRTGFSSQFDLTTLDGENGFKLNGINPGDASGESVSSAGDLNGDSIDDLVIGARSFGNNQGQSYVVFGRSTGFSTSLELSSLNGTNGFQLTGIDGFDFAGDSVSEAGDINGDGIGDLIIGASESKPGTVKDQGEAYVIFGSRKPFPSNFSLAILNGVNGFTIEGVDIDGRLGDAVSAVGDVNNDGIDDVAVSASFADPDGINNAGKSFIIFGQQGQFAPRINVSAFNGKNGFTLNGIDESDFAGRSISGLGDINGDNIDDLVIGALGREQDGIDSAGESYVVFGRSDAFAANVDLSTLDGKNGFTLKGGRTRGRSGASVSRAGDFNGDGLNDLLIGEPGVGTNPGRSYVLFGDRDGFAASIDLKAENFDGTQGILIEGVAGRTQQLGESVSDAGDVNGDGVDDLILGAFDSNPDGKERAGESYLIFGNSAPDLDLNGQADGINFATTFVGQGPVAITSPELSLTDNSSTVEQAVISIENLKDGGSEILTADTSGTNIVASYNSIQGKLILQGTDTIEHYQQVLRTLTYENRAANPSPEPRKVAFEVSDNGLFANTSAIATTSIEFENIATPGISITRIEGDILSEAGDTQTFEVVLDSSTNSTVDITLDPNGQLDLGNGRSQSLTLSFTPDTASTPQIFTASAFDDHHAEGEHQGKIRISSQSSDTAYDDLEVPNLLLMIQDNDNLIVGTPDVDVLNGTDQNDLIKGLKSDDQLMGHSGDDVLIGGFGNDSLLGGSGADRYRFRKPSQGVDVILDFESGDTIDLSLKGFGLDGNRNASLDELQFTLGSQATTPEQRIIYDQNSGTLFFDQDGSGAIAPLELAKLKGQPELTHTDIQLF